MSAFEKPRLDEAASAAIAELTTRTPSKIARRVQRAALGLGAVTLAGTLAVSVGWVPRTWDPIFFVAFAGAAVIGVGVEQFYSLKWKFLARQQPWTSLALGGYLLYHLVMHRLDARAGMAGLGVVAGLLGLGIFADELFVAHRTPRRRRALFGTGVLSLGLFSLGALLAVGNDLPNPAWRVLFLSAVALLAVGAVLFFRERARPVPPPLWERQSK